MAEARLLAKNWASDFRNFLSGARKEIIISSPFINKVGVDFLLNSGNKNCTVTILANLSCSNIVRGITDPNSMVDIFKKFKNVKVSSVENLHAKIYITDNTKAIVTSANLTSGGIYNNLEYGVLFSDTETVELIQGDLRKYFSLGNIFDRNFLSEILEMTERIEQIIEKDDGKHSALNELLMKNRVKGGKTVNGIFSDTILYLLDKHEGLSTDSLNKHIRRAHPDICDDTIDRIINGQHFGKKWKHLVRGAQQNLKKQGKISLKENIWKINK